MVFRKTNAQTGRHVAVTPENSTMRHLSYGRIILNSAKPLISFSNGDHETALKESTYRVMPSSRPVK